MVSTVSVIISSQTEIRGGSIAIGSAVRVQGQTQGNHVVLAERIELLPAGAKLPELKDEPEQNKDSSQEDNSGKGLGEDSSRVEETAAPVSDHKDESLNNTVDSISNDSSSQDNSNDNKENGGSVDSSHQDSANDSGGGSNSDSEGGGND
jgi:hypothetical protein